MRSLVALKRFQTAPARWEYGSERDVFVYVRVCVVLVTETEEEKKAGAWSSKLKGEEKNGVHAKWDGGLGAEGIERRRGTRDQAGSLCTKAE
jgi:hypothetical protein